MKERGNFMYNYLINKFEYNVHKRIGRIFFVSFNVFYFFYLQHKVLLLCIITVSWNFINKICTHVWVCKKDTIEHNLRKKERNSVILMKVLERERNTYVAFFICLKCGICKHIRYSKFNWYLNKSYFERHL